MSITAFTTSTAVDEPIEIRLARPRNDAPYTLIAWRNLNGTVGYGLTVAGSGTSHALSNLQSKGVFPGKAVAGWQAEVLEFAQASIYEVVLAR